MMIRAVSLGASLRIAEMTDRQMRGNVEVMRKARF
jgi:hypothetical protein